MLIAQNLDQFDPLQIAATEDKAKAFSTPGGIITEFLRGYAFPLAGLILFVMLVWGGFEIMTSSVSGKKDAGRQRITTAIIGFVLLFSAYWLAQIVELIFGIKFLG